MNRILTILLILCFGLTSCFEPAQNGRTTTDAQDVTGGGAVGGGGSGSGDGVTNTDGTVGGEDDDIIAKVEIRHLIEPKVDDDSDGGEYKRKLTIPKNYNGYLYLAGINMTSLNSKTVKVRFNFGYDSQSKTIDATISTAPGLTPQTNVEVLVLDMRSSPFEDVQLVYDLFDYNTYDFDDSGSDPGALTEPVTSNRDDNLYCRGLSLKDDPTYTGTLSAECDATDSVCKYAYAKVVDKGLVLSGTPNIPIVPSEINAMSGSLGYYEDTEAIKLQRCLPDDPSLSAILFAFDAANPFSAYNETSTNKIDDEFYIYQGPYRTINSDQWEIKDNAMYGPFGIFGDLMNAADIDSGYKSKLFPLYTKSEFLKDEQYLGSIIPDDEKEVLTMPSNGESFWMDGCNERARTVHNITGESIGSCSVTATIEIIAIDDDLKQTVVDITDEVKLQLVKPTQLDTAGDNVLLSSFQQCSSSSQCGSDSCCINKRCWSKTIVSQCVEDLPNYGNKVTGESCTSDYQCSSYCCNTIDGRCAPHDTVSENPVLCSKPSGQACVAKEWCMKHPVTTCAIVLTNTDPLGNKTCALRCITAEVFGECVSSDGVGVGSCVPPTQPASPTYNPTDPNRCDEAITLDQLIELANNPQ